MDFPGSNFAQRRLLFVVFGSQTAAVRRTKCIEMANSMKDLDYAGKAEIVTVDVGTVMDRSISGLEMKFWEALIKPGVGQVEIAAAASKIQNLAGDVDEDAAFEVEAEETSRLMRYASMNQAA